MCAWGQEVMCLVPVRADDSHIGVAYWKWAGVDACLAPMVNALNKAGILTRTCCCGHGKRPGEIRLWNGMVVGVPTDGLATKMHKGVPPL